MKLNKTEIMERRKRIETMRTERMALSKKLWEGMGKAANAGESLREVARVLEVEEIEKYRKENAAEYAKVEELRREEHTLQAEINGSTTGCDHLYDNKTSALKTRALYGSDPDDKPEVMCDICGERWPG